METGPLTYITCEHVEKTDAGFVRHPNEYHTIALPNKRRLTVCEICYSIIVGKVMEDVLGRAVTNLNTGGCNA